MAQIDYDLLAEAIIRKQTSAPAGVPLLSGQETSHGEIISSSPSNVIRGKKKVLHNPRSTYQRRPPLRCQSHQPVCLIKSSIQSLTMILPRF